MSEVSKNDEHEVGYDIERIAFRQEKRLLQVYWALRPMLLHGGFVNILVSYDSARGLFVGTGGHPLLDG